MQWLATSCHFYGHFTAADQMAAGSLFKVSMTGGIPGIRHHGFEDVKKFGWENLGYPYFFQGNLQFFIKSLSSVWNWCIPPHTKQPVYRAMKKKWILRLPYFQSHVVHATSGISGSNHQLGYIFGGYITWKRNMTTGTYSKDMFSDIVRYDLI
jgi:hypothetical protein